MDRSKYSLSNIAAEEVEAHESITFLTHSTVFLKITIIQIYIEMHISGYVVRYILSSTIAQVHVNN